MILKIFISALILLGVTLLSPLAKTAPAFTEKPGGADCKSCHTLNKAEAEKLLKTKKFKANIKSIKESPIKGLWQVEIELKDKKALVYVDFAKKFLVEGRFTELSKLGVAPEMKKVDISTIPLDDAIILGSPDAEKKLIVFDDPECPYCRKLHVEIKKLLETRKDIAFYIKQYPLSIHPAAYKKSQALICSKDAKMLDDVFAGKDVGEPTCDNTAQVDKNIKLAQGLGIAGTPGIIFPDGRLLPGFISAEALEALIDDKTETK